MTPSTGPVTIPPSMTGFWVFLPIVGVFVSRRGSRAFTGAGVVLVGLGAAAVVAQPAASPPVLTPASRALCHGRLDGAYMLMAV